MLTMPPHQRKAFDKICAAVETITLYHDPVFWAEHERDELFYVTLEDAVLEMGRATSAVIRTELWRANLIVGVVVEEWLDALRSNGEREALRSIQKGLERGVRSLPNLRQPTALDAEIITLHRKGYSLGRIASRVVARGLKERMDRQTVHRRLDKLGLVPRR